MENEEGSCRRTKKGCSGQTGRQTQVTRVLSGGLKESRFSSKGTLKGFGEQMQTGVIRIGFTLSPQAPEHQTDIYGSR